MCPANFLWTTRYTKRKVESVIGSGRKTCSSIARLGLMHAPRQYLIAMILSLLLSGCAVPERSSEFRPFPPDWTAYTITTKQAQIRWDAYWKDAFALAGNDSGRIATYKQDQLESQHRWSAFIGQMQPGDQLWYFSTPHSSWTTLAGREGYAIVRHGRRVDSYIVRMN